MHARLTPGRYLEIERAAEGKSEYRDGQMFARPGGMLAHALLVTQLVAALSERLQGCECTAVSSDLRVGIGAEGPFVYPDALVYCGKPALADGHSDMLLNPAAIFEVLSPSTEAYDRGYKFAQYRRLESLHEYVLVSQSEPRIEVFARGTEGKWILTEFVGIAAVCRLTSIACDIALADVYKAIAFR